MRSTLIIIWGFYGLDTGYNYDEEGLTIGAGVRHSTGQLGLRVDYALVDFGRLNYVHLVTLGITYK